MSLIYACAARLLWPRVLELVLFSRRRIPETSIISWRYGQILRHVFDPRRESVDTLATGELQGDL